MTVTVTGNPAEPGAIVQQTRIQYVIEWVSAFFGKLKVQLRVMPSRFSCAWKAFKVGNYRLLIKDVVFDGEGWVRQGQLILNADGSVVGVMDVGIPALILRNVYVMSKAKGDALTQAIAKGAQRAEVNKLRNRRRGRR